MVALTRVTIGGHWGTNTAGEMARERMGWEEGDACVDTPKKLECDQSRVRSLGSRQRALGGGVYRGRHSSNVPKYSWR